MDNDNPPLTNPSRRSVMAALAGLSVAHATTAAETDGGNQARPSSRVLVAYFTRSGNTRVVAGLIERALAADVFEIRPVTPYPEEYLATVAQAREERDRSIEPPLLERIPNLASYEVVYLGFPIWGETTPPIIRSFLKSHDLGGKKLVPFITHGGFGLGSSRDVLKRYAPNAQLAEGFSMQADQERHTMNLVTTWLGASRSNKTSD